MTEQQQFEEYFQLQHQVAVNLVKGELHSTPLSEAQFTAMIPTPFVIASEMKGLEQTMLRPLRQLGDVIEPLADYLKAQSRKIDLLMSYVLQGQDDKSHQYFTQSYGGGGFTLLTEDPLSDEHWHTCKLFFNDDATAVFCLAKIIASEQQDDGTLYTFIYQHIRDEDREVIVRASLHQQSKQLLKKTQQKQIAQTDSDKE